MERGRSQPTDTSKSGDHIHQIQDIDIWNESVLTLSQSLKQENSLTRKIAFEEFGRKSCIIVRRTDVFLCIFLQKQKAITHVGYCSTWEVLRRFTDRKLENLKALAIIGSYIVPEFAAVQNKRKDIGLYKLTNIKGLRNGDPMSVRAQNDFLSFLQVDFIRSDKEHLLLMIRPRWVKESEHCTGISPRVHM